MGTLIIATYDFPYVVSAAEFVHNKITNSVKYDGFEEDYLQDEFYGNIFKALAKDHYESIGYDYEFLKQEVSKYEYDNVILIADGEVIKIW